MAMGGGDGGGGGPVLDIKNYREVVVIMEIGVAGGYL